MSDLSFMLEDFLNLAESKNEDMGLWREDPVNLLDFFKSKDFLNESPYKGKQTQLLEEVNYIVWWKLTGDRKLCPKDLRKVTEYIVLFGKGSGKDFLISGILAYVCYLLCCMNNPHKYFGFGQEEPIDLVNIALNAYQANNVFFKKLKARLSVCSWFKKVNFNPAEKEGVAPNCYQITKQQIRFYKNITAHSAHSEADSFEGFNPLVIIFDEIGGFDIKVAEDCYNTMRSSAVTRYKDKAFLMFISFPRSSEDFMMRKMAEAAADGGHEVRSIKGTSWEVNPNITRESLDKDYKTDPEGADTKFACNPPKFSSALFKFPERIDSCVSYGKFSQCFNLIIQEKVTCRTLRSGEERFFAGLEVFNLNLNPDYIYYLGGDGGLNNDNYIISLFHAEPVLVEDIENGETVQKWFNRPVEDLTLEWRPCKANRLPVDLLNVADIIERICKQVFVKKALFDTFNSAEVIQRLINIGVDAEDKVWSNPFQVKLYQTFKGLIYTGQISLLDYKSIYKESYDNILDPNDELKAIKIINNNKIDHDKNKSKDFSDARGAAVWICSQDEAEVITHTASPSIIGVKRT